MRPEPRCTYRLQLGPGLDLDQAAALVPYLAELGVSHLYASPYLQAAKGSTHGYDVVDPTRVNAELGGEAAHQRLCAALAQAGLGQLLDIVPNHMAIIGDQNPWWWDVLENGPSSQFAAYFDVDWEASEERWPNKVLLPVLGDHYGRVLEAGGLRLQHHDGVITLGYGEQRFPLDPGSLGVLLGAAAEALGSELLAFLAESCHRLPRPDATRRSALRHRDKAVIQRLLARLCREEPRAAAALDAEVARLNADPDALDGLIERQNYRLALWRTAGRDLGYRRFFDINELAGLRVEDEEVFAATHVLPLAWVRDGLLLGLRVDHPDGLRDPAQYFQRLRAAAPETWLLAEKILEPDEDLPADWPIDGTTGYDFLNRVQGLFVDPEGEGPLTRLWEELTGDSRDFGTLVLEAKHQVVRELLGSELNRLVALFVAVCERHRRHRDYTRHDLQQALLEVATGFPVYRSYVRAGAQEVSVADRRAVEVAVERARARRPELDPELFGFLAHLLLLRHPGALEGELAMRFQQLSAPAMAKGVEDTAFYRYHRLVALNEVGGDPGRFGVSVPAFHQACAAAQAERPRALLATSTHDSKRSEDVRARLVLLSEIPGRWAEAVRRWMDHSRRHRRGELPDAATEYLLYQTLIGAWPIETQRVTAYLEKAVREAKVHSSWTQPQAEYEDAVRGFAEAVLADPELRADLAGFVAPLIQPGRVNGLAQTLLKLTAPGVPDLYQGTELWDLSLVDPDNRRPVDFAQRRALLAELPGLSPEQILARSDEGLPKLWVIRQALHLRRADPDPFGPEGSYQPVDLIGAKAGHGLAFVRGGRIAVLVPRLVLGLAGDWGDTRLALPPGAWRNRLTGDAVPGGEQPVGVLLDRFPIALLAREDPP